MRHITTQRKNHRHGFSLVEMSIVMVIMSIIVTGGLLATATFMQRQAYNDSQERLNEIFDAVRNYYGRVGRIPCPARPNIELGAAGFGIEGVTPVGSGGTGLCHDDPDGAPASVVRISTPTATDPHPDAIRIGAVPTRTLGLSDEHIADGFGNRFIYAMTEALSSTSQFSEKTNLTATAVDVYPATVQLLDRAGSAIMDDIAFIVVAMGENGSKTGTYRYITGVRAGTCGTGRMDAENCDEDGQFREILFNNGDVAANYFDDYVRFAKKSLLSTHSLANIGKECSKATQGIMRYNPDGGGTREYCNGFHWQAMPDSTGTATVQCFAFEAGKIRLQPSNSNNLQECNGEIWVNF